MQQPDISHPASAPIQMDSMHTGRVSQVDDMVSDFSRVSVISMEGTPSIGCDLPSVSLLPQTHCFPASKPVPGNDAPFVSSVGFAADRGSGILTLEAVSFSDSDWSAICDNFAEKDITTLRVHGSALSEAALQAVARFVRAFPIDFLQICDCKFATKGVGMASLCAAIQESRVLSSIDFQGSSLAAPHLHDLLVAVKENKTIASCNIHGTPLTEDAVDLMTEIYNTDSSQCLFSCDDDVLPEAAFEQLYEARQRKCDLLSFYDSFSRCEVSKDCTEQEECKAARSIVMAQRSPSIVEFLASVEHTAKAPQIAADSCSLSTLAQSSLFDANVLQFVVEFLAMPPVPKS